MPYPKRPFTHLLPSYLSLAVFRRIGRDLKKNTADLPAGIQPQSQLIFIDWVGESLDSLETTHAIGRKILLIPGAFQDFNAFPAESMAVEQFETFARVLDASDIFAGLGSFIWGDRQEGPFPFIGARSLSSVRAAVATAFRNQLQSPLVRESIGGSDTSALPPAMSPWSAQSVHAGISTRYPFMAPHRGISIFRMPVWMRVR